MNSRLHKLTRTPGGVFLRKEALELGYDDRAIARAVRSGEWHRLRHGAYCSGGVWRNADSRTQRMLVARAAFRTARAHVLFSHASAMDLLGGTLWEPPDEVFLTRTDGKTGRREAGVAQGAGHIIAADVTRRDGWWVTSGTRTALDMTRIADVEHSVVAINSLIHAGETSREALDQRVAAMARWPMTLSTDLVLRLVDGRCESAGESRLSFMCWQQGLPRPIPQYEIKDRDGRVIHRVDFAWPELGVFLEFDGKVKYEKYLRPGESAADAVFREKRREERICELTGWRCIRVSWSDLYDPERLAARIRAVFATGPRRAA